MIQQLETTLRSNAVPQAPRFAPSAVNQSVQTASNSTGAGSAQTTKKDGDAEGKSKPESTSQGRDVSSSSSKDENKPSGSTVIKDPLGDARNRVQEEISMEFASIMASGTLRASEAAALATKRVMQRYGHMGAAQS